MDSHALDRHYVVSDLLEQFPYMEPTKTWPMKDGQKVAKMYKPESFSTTVPRWIIEVNRYLAYLRLARKIYEEDQDLDNKQFIGAGIIKSWEIEFGNSGATFLSAFVFDDFHDWRDALSLALEDTISCLEIFAEEFSGIKSFYGLPSSYDSISRRSPATQVRNQLFLDKIIERVDFEGPRNGYKEKLMQTGKVTLRRSLFKSVCNLAGEMITMYPLRLEFGSDWTVN